MAWIVLACVVGGVILLVLLFSILGSRLPPDHVLVCTVRLKAAPEAVFAAVDDVAKWPEWDDGVKTVEPLPPVDGREACVMHVGHNAMHLVTTRREPPRVLERTVEDAGKKMFSGSWLHEITPEGSGCVVRLTERGTIHVPIARFMARNLADPALYLKRHLRVLAAKFGEEAVIEVPGRAS